MIHSLWSPHISRPFIAAMSPYGATDSKPILDIKHEDISVRQSPQKPTKLRRFMSIGSRSRDTIRSKHHTSTSISHPIQPHASSLRSIESESRPKTLPKRSISNFLLLRTSTAASEGARSEEYTPTSLGYASVPGTSSKLVPSKATRGGEDYTGSRGRLPVTSSMSRMVQMQPRKDSATKSFSTMSAAAYRTAALTSHPVGQEDFGQGI